MVLLTELVAFTDQYLAVQCKDGCPNGLQVQGKRKVSKLVSAVSASYAALEQAVLLQADALLVHHGYFWRHDDPTIRGLLYNRLSYLMQHQLSLIAYHLPLDYHEEVGNNAQLANVMHWNIEGRMPSSCGIDIGLYGVLSAPMTIESLRDDLAIKLLHTPLVIATDASKQIRRIAWCTGAAGDDIIHAHKLGVDAFITGEIAERTVHVARELNIVLFAAGHHATERYGVQALGKLLSNKYAIEHEFVDIPSPV